MLLEIIGICQHCAEEVKVLVLNGEPLDRCNACGEPPFGVRQVKGLIYVVSNPHQVGVKVGLTTKSMEQRLKELSSTGVPGDFEPIAIFPSDRPKADEKRVHDKLKRFNIAKEHFDLDPIEAVVKAYRALNRRTPIFFDDEKRSTFELMLEHARTEMQLRLRGQGK
jgi:hypothetical protein